MVSFFAVFAAVYPSSELSSGGNYNLRYLPADFRRRLRSNSGNRNRMSSGSPFDLTFDQPTTLYIQNAGFLWADSAVWDAEVSAFGQDEYVRSHAIESISKAYSIPEFLSHRVVFEDKIRRICKLCTILMPYWKLIICSPMGLPNHSLGYSRRSCYTRGSCERATTSAHPQLLHRRISQRRHQH